MTMLHVGKWMLRGWAILFFLTQPHLVAQGINLPENTDYTPLFQFADAMKNARGWARVEKRYEAGGVSLDEKGWPKEDAAIVLHASVKGLGGVYRISFEGKATLKAPDGGKIVESNFDASSGLTSAKLEVPPTQTILSLSFTETDKGVRQVKVLRETAAKGVFTQELIDRVAMFKVLRFMDWMRTNGSPQQSWNARPLPDKATWSGTLGVPIEVCIDLCNETKKDAWVCIPHQADDEFVRAYAKLVKERLDPSLKVYVEYSNELWNFQFKQTQSYREKAARIFDDKVAQGQTQESKRNQEMYPIMWDLISARVVEVMKIWREEFGPGDRLVTVIGSQAANSYITRCLLKNPALGESVNALAIAPYFGHSVGSQLLAEKVLAGGKDVVFSELEEEIATKNKKWVDEAARLAKERGLTLIAYEAGQHLVPGTKDAETNKKLNALFAEANRDPRMGELYWKASENWRAAGGGLVVYFNLMSTYGGWGYWGLFEDMSQTSTPKFEAVKKIMETVPTSSAAN